MDPDLETGNPSAFTMADTVLTSPPPFLQLSPLLSALSPWYRYWVQVLFLWFSWSFLREGKGSLGEGSVGSRSPGALSQQTQEMLFLLVPPDTVSEII